MSAQPSHPPAPLRRCLQLAIAAQFVLLAAGLRHHLVWGDTPERPWLLPLLNGAEALAVVAAAALGGFGWWRALQLVGADAPPLRRLVWWTVPLLLAAVLVPPFLTTDPIDYVLRGRVLAVHGGNPYLQVAADYPGDPFLDFGDRAWKDFPLPYGPVIAVVQGAVAGLAHLLPMSPLGELIAALALFKLLFAGALLGTAAALAKRVAIDAPGEAPRAFVAIAWNPLLLLEGVANAHNDPLLAVGIALALLAERRLHLGRAVVALGVGALAKVTPVVLLPLLAARAVAARRLRGLLAGTAVLLALVGASWWAFFRADGSLDFLRRQSELQGASLPWAVHELTGLAMPTLLLAGRGIVVGVVGWQALRLLRAGPPERVPAAFAAAMATLACCGAGLFSVWYHLWWLPCALLARGTFVARFAVAATLVAPFAYLPWTCSRRLDGLSQWHIVTCAVLAPAACALWAGWRDRRARRAAE